ncbi:hypothetical protein GCM10012275_51250 [Longimycelium tulufanense]|uniref:Uncharacterized protein n=1 Tax=Longimycelium tulufanense TaxID=907463 RepID=A0A8J3CIZ6_9PSEU|nr:hypothetical protein GCM10012275_51250 [Longimycelium tulufanense]
MTWRAAMSTRSASGGAAVVHAVTVIMGVVGLTFLFGFGNVLNPALRLGVPVWVTPLVAPAVDLSDPRAVARQSTHGIGRDAVGTTAARPAAADLCERGNPRAERG